MVTHLQQHGRPICLLAAILQAEGFEPADAEPLLAEYDRALRPHGYYDLSNPGPFRAVAELTPWAYRAWERHNQQVGDAIQDVLGRTVISTDDPNLSGRGVLMFAFLSPVYVVAAHAVAFLDNDIYDSNLPSAPLPYAAWRYGYPSLRVTAVSRAGRKCR